MDIEWSSPRDNIKAVEHMLSTSPKSDLYILPEMWSTGFAIDPRGIAESDGNDTQNNTTQSVQNECGITASLQQAQAFL